MYVKAADIRNAQKAGRTVVHVDHATYVAEYFDRMSSTYSCPHTQSAPVAR
jgi:hypothetical protein